MNLWISLPNNQGSPYTLGNTKGCHSGCRQHLAAPKGDWKIREDILICLPDRLHPVSKMFLERWLSGEMTTAEFLRWFHMPNSSYLSVAECLLAVVAGA